MKRREEPKLDATLSVRGEALNLPSMDPHCLAVVTYLKFINIKTARIETQPQANQPYMIVTDTDKKKKQITGAKSVIDHIRTQQPPSKYDLDAGLTAKQRSRYNAVMALVQESLLPSVMYYWWLYSANYSHTVAPAISSQVSFLSGLFRPGRIQKSVKQQLLTKFGRKVSKVEVFATIQKTLESISTLLNNKPFFLGQDKPSSLDAYVFSCLACLYYPKFKDPSVSSLLKKHPSLTKYCTEIARKYFTDCPEVLKPPLLDDTTVTIESLREEAITQQRENRKTWLFLGASSFMLAVPVIVKYLINLARATRSGDDVNGYEEGELLQVYEE